MASLVMRLNLLLYLLLACLLRCSPKSLSLAHCSDACQSKFCTVAETPLLRYGRYCGIFYSGCHGEAPCDGLDTCCQDHDNCINNTGNYLSVLCNQNLLDCLIAYRRSGQPQFQGATCSSEAVVNTIDFAIEAGVWIGKEIPPEYAQNFSSTSTGLRIKTTSFWKIGLHAWSTLLYMHMVVPLVNF